MRARTSTPFKGRPVWRLRRSSAVRQHESPPQIPQVVGEYAQLQADLNADVQLIAPHDKSECGGTRLSTAVLYMRQSTLMLLEIGRSSNLIRGRRVLGDVERDRRHGAVHVDVSAGTIPTGLSL